MIESLIHDITIIKGPHSNFINISHNGNFRKKMLLWDEYCHYERESKLVLNLEGVNETISFDVLNETFDRSKCRRRYDFSTITNSRFETVEICFEGEYSAFSL